MSLWCTLIPSWYLAGFLGAAYVGSCLCVIFSDVPFWIKLPLVLFALAHAYHVLSRYALLRDAKAIVRCCVQDKTRWQLATKSGDIYKADILGDSWSSAFMVVLNFRQVHNQKRVSVLLLKGMLAPDVFRKLRVYLNVLACPI